MTLFKSSLPLKFLLMCSILLMSHCQSLNFLQKPKTVKNLKLEQFKALSRKDREALLESLEQWQFKGKIGMAYNQDNKRKSLLASLNWLQQKQNFEMKLAGPLGMGQVQLNRSDKGTTFTNSRGEKFKDKTPEALFKYHTGLPVPLSDLSWWLKGLAVKSKNVDESRYDEFNRLSYLKQSQWEVNYSDYQVVLTPSLELELPRKIKLNYYDLNITIVIKKWALHE